MRTKAAIINEIQENPELFAMLVAESQDVLRETGVKVDPIDLGLLQAVFADRLGFQGRTPRGCVGRNDADHEYATGPELVLK